MKALLAAVLLLGLILPAVADETAVVPSTDAPAKDSRLARLKASLPTKVGVLTFYPNTAGGYTFIEGSEIVFYALPYWPTKSLQIEVGAYRKDIDAMIRSRRLEAMMASGQVEWRALSVIGTSKMPAGSLTFYRGDMRKTNPPDALLREDTPIAQWSPDESLFSITAAADDETRLKLKTIIPALKLAGQSVKIAEVNDKPLDADSPPEKDARLAKRGNAHVQKIGVLSYHPNKGGGYTFVDEESIVFYALPYEPSTRQVETLVLPVIGPLKMPFGGQTVYRSQLIQNGVIVEPHRMDTPIAKWTRDTPDGKFRLSILAEDSETRLKLKSIVPVLERAEHGR
jgi:hypothetical protein